MLVETEHQEAVGDVRLQPEPFARPHQPLEVALGEREVSAGTMDLIGLLREAVNRGEQPVEAGIEQILDALVGDAQRQVRVQLGLDPARLGLADEAGQVGVQ
jgi:hypothetical protein